MSSDAVFDAHVVRGIDLLQYSNTMMAQVKHFLFQLEEELVRKIQISIDKNNAAPIFVVGHYDCKGNPVSDFEHKNQVLSSVERLKKEFTDIDIIGLWINDQWGIEQL